MASLRAECIQVTISTLPCEVVDPIPCDQDDIDAAYDPVYV